METNNKPDFEKMAKEYVKFIVGTHDRPDITEHDFIQGCEKIWNDYVIVRDTKIAELEKQLLEQSMFPQIQDRMTIKVLESENQALKIELDKAAELLYESIGYFEYNPSSVAKVREIREFIKDKR